MSMTGQALIAQGNALHLPLPDGSVDLIVTSPAYFGQRDYGVGPGEIGKEPIPQQYLEALWQATAEMVRVLKPTGSIFVDLGDKYGSVAGPKTGTKSSRLIAEGGGRAWPVVPRGQPFEGMRDKSLLLLPERYRVGCVDQLGLIARAVIVWDKPNSLPESVTDRVRRSHEDWVHLTKQPRYYAATDEIREPYTPESVRTLTRMPAEGWTDNATAQRLSTNTDYSGVYRPPNPLGKLPGSVWTIPSEPLTLPGYFITQDGTLQDFLAPTRGRPRPRTNSNGHAGLFDLDPFAELAGGEDAGAWRWLRATGVNASPWPQQDDGLQLRTAASHYAAFPSRWPEQLIKAFSPPGICLDCGQGRTPVVDKQQLRLENGQCGCGIGTHGSYKGTVPGRTGKGTSSWEREGRGYCSQHTILGYACACTPHTNHPGSVREGPRNSGNGWAAGTGDRDNPGGGYGNNPRTGPWREYHLDGWTPPPTRPSVVLDPFSGTGTTPMVARALGRIGIGIDLSAPYCRAARWRVHHDAGKAISRTWTERQGSLL